MDDVCGWADTGCAADVGDDKSVSCVCNFVYLYEIFPKITNDTKL